MTHRTKDGVAIGVFALAIAGCIATLAYIDGYRRGAQSVPDGEFRLLNSDGTRHFMTYVPAGGGVEMSAADLCQGVR